MKSQNTYTAQSIGNIFKTEKSDSIFICNVNNNERYSIHDLSKLLHKTDNNMKYGENAYTEEIENGHIE
ncbi:hypothetical protein M1725_23765, partial [Salmonella enterica subsp. enterica serovar Oranienburg]|nr:hypothetical protein [Salmonella enterica subsp. enterica serovar Oranienburg]